MEDDCVAAARGVASYLIECMVYNVPNEGFGHSTYTADVRYALAHIFNSTMTNATCEKCVEVNKMKWLFRYAQPWSRQQAHSFIRAARRADAGAGGAEDDGQAGGEDPAGAAEGRRLPLPPPSVRRPP